MWTSEGQDGDGDGVFGRLIEAAAGPVGPEFQANVYSEDDQFDPVAASGPAAGFLLVWASVGQDGSSTGVYARRFDASGSAVGAEVQVNAYTESFQTSPWVAPIAAGGFLVVWASQGQDGDLSGIFGRRLSPDGLPAGSEFQVTLSTVGDQRLPRIAAAPDGSFVVTWVHSDPPPTPAEDNDGFMIRLDADGNPLSPERRINLSVPVQVQIPVAFEASGAFMAVWCPASIETPADGVWGRRFDPSGMPLGPDFRIDPGQTGRNFSADLVPDGQGGGVLVWERGEGMLPIQDFEVLGVRLDRAGLAVGSEVVLSDRTVDQGMGPTAVAASPGEIVVAWTDREGRDGDLAGVFARRVESPIGVVAIPVHSLQGGVALAFLLVVVALLRLRRRGNPADTCPRSIPTSRRSS